MAESIEPLGSSFRRRFFCPFGRHRWTYVDLWVGYCWDCGEQFDHTPENAAEIIADLTRGGGSR